MKIIVHENSRADLFSLFQVLTWEVSYQPLRSGSGLTEADRRSKRECLQQCVAGLKSVDHRPILGVHFHNLYVMCFGVTQMSTPRILRHPEGGQPFCLICNRPVSLETAKTNEDG